MDARDENETLEARPLAEMDLDPPIEWPHMFETVLAKIVADRARPHRWDVAAETISLKERLLREGWEPFAVEGNYMWFRKWVPVEDD